MESGVGPVFLAVSGFADNVNGISPEMIEKCHNLRKKECAVAA